MANGTQNSRLTECRVLLVEDERIIRELILRMLSSLGIEDVVDVSSAEAGWDYLVGRQRRGFDVVITDIALPGMSGIGLVKALRELPAPRARTLPVVVVSGCTDLDKYKQLERLGISSYLVKPVSATLLNDALTTALAGRIANSTPLVTVAAV